MRCWVLVAGLLAAAAATPALAADLGDGSGRYDDRPYEDYSNDDDEDYDDGGDDEDDYEDGSYDSPEDKKYAGAQPSYGKTCARSGEVRERLTHNGWRDFHAGQSAGEMITLQARRPNGRLFELTLERCSGQIVDARSLERQPLRPFAFKAPREPYGPRPSDRYDSRDPWLEGPSRRPRPWFRD